MKNYTYIIDYSKSGIKTTRGFANVYLIISIILTLGLFIAAIEEESGVLGLYALLSITSGFLINGSLSALACIAENSLINKEQQNEIISLLKNNQIAIKNEVKEKDDFDFLEK